MRRILIITCLTLLSCCGQEEKTPASVESESSHPRAAAAAKRVQLALERDLAAKGLRFGGPVFIRAFKCEFPPADRVSEGILTALIWKLSGSNTPRIRKHPTIGCNDCAFRCSTV